MELKTILSMEKRQKLEWLAEEATKTYKRVDKLHEKIQEYSDFSIYSAKRHLIFPGSGILRAGRYLGSGTI